MALRNDPVSSGNWSAEEGDDAREQCYAAESGEDLPRDKNSYSREDQGYYGELSPAERGRGSAGHETHS